MVEQKEEFTSKIREVPYPPSWIDHLIQWVDRLPVPAWLFYVLSIVALALVINIVLWIDGSVPFGSFGSIHGVNPLFVVYPIAFYHYLTQFASRSLKTYRPLLDVDDAELARIDYELATLPSWIAWLFTVIALGTVVRYVWGDPATFEGLVPRTVLPYIAAFIIVGPFSAAIFCIVARTVRQLWMVSRLHAQATKVNLLRLEPAHAFSGLTARTGIGLILMLFLGYLYDPSGLNANTFDLAQYTLITLTAIIIFVVPVMGLRKHLEAEKERALDEISALLQATSESLHNKVNNKDYEDIGGMETALGALIREREMLGKISTWPWNTGTIRGFASTLLLPIFLWLVTRLLGRYF